MKDHLQDFFPILICTGILVAWMIEGSFSITGILVIAFFINPVFTSRPILFRVLGRSTTTSDWVAIAAVAVGSLFSAWVGGVAAGWAVVLVMAGLTLSHALTTVSTLNSDSAS